MKLFLLILGVVVVALNVFLWYTKKHSGATTADKSSGHKRKSPVADTTSSQFLNGPEAEPLKQAAAAELGISVEQLNRMSAEEIELLAAEKGIALKQRTSAKKKDAHSET